MVKIASCPYLAVFFPEIPGYISPKEVPSDKQLDHGDDVRRYHDKRTCRVIAIPPD